MLILSRTPGEEIVIGNEVITIEVSKVQGNRVTLAIKAPRELPIYRREVFEARKAEAAVEVVCDG